MGRPQAGRRESGAAHRARRRVPAGNRHLPPPGTRLTDRLALEQLGEGEPLVLVHGLATTRAIWNAVAPALARSRRVVTLDVPGFGDSEPVGSGFVLGAVAGRIADGLRGAGVDGPLDLVGHSLGAGVALTLAAEHPDIVRRLVLVAPAGLSSLPRPLSGLLGAASEAALTARRRAGALADFRWGRRLLLGFAAADPAALAPTQARMMIDASMSARRTSAAFTAITSTDLRPLLQRTSAPTGVIWGERDRTIPVRLADVVRDERPDVDVVVVPRAGHVLMVERPEAFVDALEELLVRLPKDATTRRVRTSTVR